jgi:hypothetical protein
MPACMASIALRATRHANHHCRYWALRVAIFHQLFARHPQVMWKSTSSRWRDDLTAGQQAVLEDSLREDLLRYGYDLTR